MEARIETVGPIQDFALDYVIEVQINRSAGQVFVRSREWVVKPARYDIGETLDEALSRQSRFRTILAGVTPATTVTLWCYPDSFEEYRAVREELHRIGVSAACRPLWKVLQSVDRRKVASRLLSRRTAKIYGIHSTALWISCVTRGRSCFLRLTTFFSA